MEPGKHRHRLRIEQRTTAQEEAFGTRVDTWTTWATVWAEVEDVLPSRGESVVDGIAIAERPARVRMRYRQGLTSDMRAIDLSRGNRELRIATQPVEMGNKQRLEFMVADFTTTGGAV